jgi:hypothetical protein
MKGLAATIHARATQDAGFKRCCMLTGRYDGIERDYFFSRLTTGLAGNAGAVSPTRSAALSGLASRPNLGSDVSPIGSIACLLVSKVSD